MKLVILPHNRRLPLASIMILALAALAVCRTGLAADLPTIPGVSFVAIEDSEVPWTAWGEHEASGFSFLYDRIGDATSTPQRMLVLFPGDPSNPCFIEPALRQAAESRPTLLLQVLLDAESPFTTGEETPLLDLCRALRTDGPFPPEEVILVGEGARSATVLELASNHRSEFGGVLIWEGEPGAALAPNLDQTSLALLGDRKKLASYHLFLEQCRIHSVPVKMNTYWGSVEEYELVSDLAEILEWMYSPSRKPVGRMVSHTTYLPRYGHHGWLWITELLSPGRPGSVSVHWRNAGIVETKPEGVRRFRLKLDNSFDRYGRRIEFVVGRLRLPVTLKMGVEAIEFEYSEVRDTWSARFLPFSEPIPERVIIPTLKQEFPAGDWIPGFAGFARARTEVDCAWGERFPRSVPVQGLTAEDLYRLAPPVPFVVWETTLDAVDAFDSWRRSHGEEGIEVSFAPGIRAKSAEASSNTLRTLVSFPVLNAYFQSIGELPPADLPIQDNLQQLLGASLRRETFTAGSAPSSASVAPPGEAQP